LELIAYPIFKILSELGALLVLASYRITTSTPEYY